MSKKLTIESIRASFENSGYVLKTTKYKNAHQKLNCICPNGHFWSVTWNKWQQGRRCPCCYGNVKKIIEPIRASFENSGYILKTIKYENNKQKLDCVCPRGHFWSVSWNSWQQGARCFYCAGNKRHTIELVRFNFEENGYILITTNYINAHCKLKCICPNGHIWFVKWNDWQQGIRCPKCSNRISKWEKEVKNFFNDLNINYVSNDRVQLINPKTNCSLELDIWFPQLDKAVECNGVYWHNKSKKKGKSCDVLKQQLCKNQGIDLLVITDEEWNEDIDKCKRKLISFIKTEV